MPTREDVFKAFRRWYDNLPSVKQNKDLPARGTIGGALVVLERLKDQCDLSIRAHLTRGGGQVAGVSGGKVNAILREFGEERRIATEFRTNRGLIGYIEAMLISLQDAGLAELPNSERCETIIELQRFLVDGFVSQYFGQQLITAVYDPAQSVWQMIHELLGNADKVGKQAVVAQHLVGAKLAVRYPDSEIGNLPSSAGDKQTGRHGDFELGHAVFHITISPSAGVIDRCQENLDEGWKPYLIVPQEAVDAARLFARQRQLEARISFASVESFVSQNIEEISSFDRDSVRTGLKQLFEEYNRRVLEAETDPSVQVQIPQSLL